MTHNTSRLRINIRLIAASFILALLVIVLPGFYKTRASNPSAGTINATATTPLTWTGTATGGGALNAPLLIGSEDLCQEGLTCDTFTLTVGCFP
jgi:hypothetical protein